MTFRVGPGDVGDISSSRALEIIQEALDIWSNVTNLDLSLDQSNGFDPEVDSGEITLRQYFLKYVLPSSNEGITSFHTQRLGYTSIVFLDDNSLFNQGAIDPGGIAVVRIVDGDQILESGIAIDASRHTFNSSGLTTQEDLELRFKKSILHEIGHTLGLNHLFSINPFFNQRSQSLLPPLTEDSLPIMNVVPFFEDTSSPINLTEGLTMADLSLARHLYPESNFFGSLFSSEGIIQGTAETRDERPLLGGYLIASKIDGTPDKAFSYVDIKKEGVSTYQIPGLEPGTYVLSIHLLNDDATGFHEPYLAHSMPKKASQGYINNSGDIVRSEYADVINDPSFHFTVSAGNTTEVNFIDFRLSDDNPNNSNELADEPFKIEHENSLVRGEIETSGDIDFFKLEVPVAGTINLDISCRFSCQFSFLDTDKSVISSTDSRGGNFSSQLALDEGIYYLEMKGNQSLNFESYRIRTRDFLEGACPLSSLSLSEEQVIPATCSGEPEVPEPPPGEIAFRVEQDGLTTDFIPITNNVTIGEVAWRFGDGNSSNEERPQHRYSQPGRYLVELDITNTNTGRTLRSSTFITVDRNREVTEVIPVTSNPSQFSDFDMRIIGTGLPLDGEFNQDLGVFISNCLNYRTISRSNTEHLVRCTFIGSGSQDGLVKPSPGNTAVLLRFTVEVESVDLNTIATDLPIRRFLRDGITDPLVPSFFRITTDEVAEYTVQLRSGRLNRFRVTLLDEGGNEISTQESSGRNTNLKFNNLEANSRYFIQVNSLREDGRIANYRIRFIRSGEVQLDDGLSFRIVASERLFRIKHRIRSGRESRTIVRIRSEISEDLNMEAISNSNLLRFEPSEFTIAGNANRRTQVSRVIFASREEFFNNLDSLDIRQESNGRSTALFPVTFRNRDNGEEVTRVIQVNLGVIPDEPTDPDPDPDPNPGEPRILTTSGKFSNLVAASSDFVVWGENDTDSFNQGTFSIRVLNIATGDIRTIHSRELSPVQGRDSLPDFTTSNLRIDGNKVLWNSIELNGSRGEGFIEFVGETTFVYNLNNDSITTINNASNAKISGNLVVYRSRPMVTASNDLSILNLDTQQTININFRRDHGLNGVFDYDIEGNTLAIAGLFSENFTGRFGIFTFDINSQTLSSPILNIESFDFLNLFKNFQIKNNQILWRMIEFTNGGITRESQITVHNILNNTSKLFFDNSPLEGAVVNLVLNNNSFLFAIDTENNNADAVEVIIANESQNTVIDSNISIRSLSDKFTGLGGAPLSNLGFSNNRQVVFIDLNNRANLLDLQ